MKNKLEQLLNSLIEKGWKPRDEESVKSCMVGEPFYKRKFIEKDLGFYIDDRGTPQWLFTKSLREICSKGSGLWQFVCENGMLNKKRWSNRVRLETYCGGDYIEIWTGEDYRGKFDSGYEYRLIESALCDEDKLEDFILQNIVIKDE